MHHAQNQHGINTPVHATHNTRQYVTVRLMGHSTHTCHNKHTSRRTVAIYSPAASFCCSRVKSQRSSATRELWPSSTCLISSSITSGIFPRGVVYALVYLQHRPIATNGAERVYNGLRRENVLRTELRAARIPLLSCIWARERGRGAAFGYYCVSVCADVVPQGPLPQCRREECSLAMPEPDYYLCHASTGRYLRSCSRGRFASSFFLFFHLFFFIAEGAVWRGR